MIREERTAQGERSTPDCVPSRDRNPLLERDALEVRAFLAERTTTIGGPALDRLVLAFRTGLSAVEALSSGEDPLRQRQRIRIALGALRRLTRGPKMTHPP